MLSAYFDPSVLPILKMALIPIGIDVLLGVLLALKNKEFNFRWLPDFLQTQVLPYAGGLGVLALFAHDGPTKAAFMAAAATVAAKYLADWKDKLAELFGFQAE